MERVAVAGEPIEQRLFGRGDLFDRERWRRLSGRSAGGLFLGRRVAAEAALAAEEHRWTSSSRRGSSTRLRCACRRRTCESGACRKTRGSSPSSTSLPRGASGPCTVTRSPPCTIIAEVAAALGEQIEHRLETSGPRRSSGAPAVHAPRRGGRAPRAWRRLRARRAPCLSRCIEDRRGARLTGERKIERHGRRSIDDRPGPVNDVPRSSTPAAGRSARDSPCHALSRRHSVTAMTAIARPRRPSPTASRRARGRRPTSCSISSSGTSRTLGLELYPAQEQAILELFSGQQRHPRDADRQRQVARRAGAPLPRDERGQAELLHRAHQGARRARSSSRCAATSGPRTSA